MRGTTGCVISTPNWVRPITGACALALAIPAKSQKLPTGCSKNLHLKDIKLPKGVSAVIRGNKQNPVLVSVVAPVVVVETPADAAPAADAKGKGKGKK